MGGNEDKGARFFSEVTTDRARSNACKLQYIQSEQKETGFTQEGGQAMAQAGQRACGASIESQNS